MNSSRISEKDLETAILFSNIMGIDLSEAANVLASYGWDIESALASIDLNSQPAPSNKAKPPPEPNEKQSPSRKKPEHKKSKVEEKSRIRHKEKLQNNSSFQMQAHYRSERPHNFSEVEQLSKKSKLQFKKEDVATNQVFMSYITNQYHPRINFAFGSFSSNIRQSFSECKHVLVYLHYIDAQIERQYHAEVQEILRNTDIARFVNHNCIAYGVIHNSPGYAAIADYLPRDNNTPLFALFLFNHIKNKEQFLSSYNPHNQDLNFLEWLSLTSDTAATGEALHRVSEKFKKLRAHQKEEGANIEEELIEEQQLIEEEQFFGESNISDYRDREKPKPPSPIRQWQSKISPSKLKRREDNKLMEEQDAAYQKMEKSYLRKKEISELNHEFSKLKVQEREDKERELEKRQKQMEKEFPEIKDEGAMEVKIRLPNGTSKVQKFNPHHPLTKLFTYVDVFCRNQFESKFSDFELTLNYSDLVLARLKSESLEKVFEGAKAVTVIVKEVDSV